MNIEGQDHLTYEPNDYPYPWQFEILWNPTARRVYYTEAYWEEMQVKNRRPNRTVAEPVKADDASWKHKSTVSGICVACKKPFTDGQRGQVTCGKPACRKERQRQREAASYERRKSERDAERERLRGMLQAAERKQQGRVA